MATAAFKLLCNHQGDVYGIETNTGDILSDMQDLTVKASNVSQSGLTVVEATVYDDQKKAKCCWRFVGGTWVCVQC